MSSTYEAAASVAAVWFARAAWCLGNGFRDEAGEAAACGLFDLDYAASALIPSPSTRTPAGGG